MNRSSPGRGRLALLLAEVRVDLAAEARAGRRAQQEESRDRPRKPTIVADGGGADLEERLRKLRAGGLRVDAGAGDDRLGVGARRLDRDPVAGARRGDVAQLPGAAELLGEGGVDLLQVLRPAGADVAAAGLLGQPLQRRRAGSSGSRSRSRRRRRGPRARTAIACSRLASLETSWPSVSRISTRVGLRSRGERLRRDEDPVVERGAAHLVDLDRAQGGVRLVGSRGEGGQLHGLLTDRDHGDPVAGGLRARRTGGPPRTRP